jgi:hypothetical protein
MIANDLPGGMDIILILLSRAGATFIVRENSE